MFPVLLQIVGAIFKKEEIVDLVPKNEIEKLSYHYIQNNKT